MFKTSIVRLITAITLLCLSCGDKGRHSEPPPATNSPDSSAPQTPGTIDQKTKVDFDTLPYNLTIDNDPPCQSLVQSGGLVNLKAHFQQIQGWMDLPNLESWPKFSLDLSDLTGDSKDSYDLTQIGIGFWDSDLIIKWKNNNPDRSAITWEFGYLTSRENGIMRVAKTYFTVGDLGITKYSSGSEEQLMPSSAQAINSDGSTTLRLSFNEIENITTYPVWWVRGILKHGNGLDNTLDTTQSSFFNSHSNPDVKLLSIEKCHLNLPPPYDLWVEILRDSVTISDDALTTHIQNKFFSYYRKFVTFTFQMNRIVPIRPVSYAIYYLSFKEILPITGLFPTAPAPLDNGPSHTNVFHGWNLDAKSLTIESDSYPEMTLQKGFSRVIADQFLTEAWPEAPTNLLELGKSFLLFNWATSLFGNRFWIDFIAQTPETSNFSGDRKSISLSKSHELDRAAILLSESIGVKDFFSAWNHLSSYDLSSKGTDQDQLTAAFSYTLSDFLKISDKSVQLLGGWLIPGPYHPQMDKALLLDTDRDGLPAFAEKKLGTDPLKEDSDQDHWNDASEWLLGTSPLNHSDSPNALVADGNFGDWQKLLPRRIHIDRNRSGNCSKNADIELYAALAKADSLIIGAYATEFWVDDKDALWEVDLDVSANKTRYLLSAPAGSHAIFLDSIVGGEGNTPLQRKSHKIFQIGFGLPRRVFEFALNNRDLHLPLNMTNPEAIKIRIRTRYPATNPQYCDETQWFQPVQHYD